MSSHLYDTDYFLWLEKQATAIRNNDINAVDWVNLLEEIESLGREQLNALNSLLKQVIIHRLKLDYLQDELNRNHWESEINTFVDQIEDRLTNTLKNQLDLSKVYNRGKRDVLKQYPKLIIPETNPYTLDDLLTTYE